MRNLNYRRKQKQKAIERALRQLRLRQLQVIYWKNPQWVTEQAVSLGAAHHTTASCSSGTLLRFTREVTPQEMQVPSSWSEPDSPQIK